MVNREILIEITENSLLCETKERDTELATQIVDDILHALQVTDEKLVEEISNIIFRNKWFYSNNLEHAKILVSEFAPLINLSKLEEVKEAEKRGYDRHVAQMFSIEDAQSKKIIQLEVAVEEARKESYKSGINYIKEYLQREGGEEGIFISVIEAITYCKQALKEVSDSEVEK
jgi:hypothetical protein